jgi:hypothetical protein
MSEDSNAPVIEDVICELLDGDLKETALGCAAYLRANQLTPWQWFGRNYWRIPYEKSYLCGILVNKDEWRFWFFRGDYNGEFAKRFIKTVQDNVNPCVSCHGVECPQGKDMTVFGREFPNACFQFPIQFVNPDCGTLECIKELIEYWKDAAPRSDSWHAH